MSLALWRDGIERVRAALDEESSKERWITTKEGHKVLLDENGNPVKGNPKVVEKMKGGGVEKKQEHTATTEKKRGKVADKVWREAIEKGLKLHNAEFKDMRARRDKIAKKFGTNADATYDLETGEKVSFDSGVQVTFQTTGSEDGSNESESITDDEYDALCAYMSSIAGKDEKAYCGLFGAAEISFHFSSARKAKQMATHFNQNSCWNWKGSTLICNKHYDPNKNSVKGGKQETTK